MLTAGTAERHNSMLVAWGGLGTLWEMPVATAYVARARHTHGFMEASDAFTLAFFPESMRRQYVKFGTVSGRECADKAALAGVTPVAVDGGVTFEEAERTLVCRKLYSADFELDRLPEEVAGRMYADPEQLHTIYIGQVTAVLSGRHACREARTSGGCSTCA
ncbi:MAG: flavin reductase [Eggerthellaceae bacterium]|nr:flavin reductase [Eggerthellaceae bacterium]